MSYFQVLCSRTRFRRYRGHRVLFSCFARPDSFLAETRVPGTVFMFCAPGVLSRGSEGVMSRFQVLRSRTRFLRYRGHRVSFLGFSLPDSLSAVRRALGPVFMFCAPGVVVSGTEGVRSHFHVLRVRTRFRRYRGRRVTFSFFALPDSFSAVMRASGPVFLFCAP
jgi:hypothetical protein